MHIENELAEIVTIGDNEFEEIVEEYKEEILVQEEVPEPPLTDAADTAPAQGKPRCITLILLIIVCIFVVHLRCRKFYGNYIYIYIYIANHCIYIHTILKPGLQIVFRAPAERRPSPRLIHQKQLL
jgi:hypothetical protein